MRLLIDIGHPAHVHLFKNFALEMQKKGNKVLFTVRHKEFEEQLLSAYGFNYFSLGNHQKTKFGKIFSLLLTNLRMFKAAFKFHPDIFLSHGSIYAAHISWILRKPHIAFEDTFNFEQISIYKPFTSIILSGDYNHPDLGVKNIKYPGYHELAYLHPNHFKADTKIKKELGLCNQEEYALFRFVSWKATHDEGHTGFSQKNKILAVKAFSEYCRIFISSEVELPDELTPFKLKVPPEKIHDVIASSSLLFGESATMASEAAVLGVPSIYLDYRGRGYTKEQEEKYGLVYNYSDSEKDQINAIKKGIEILQSLNGKNIWEERRLRMLKEKIDITSYLVWFVENYPESVNILKRDPDYHSRFK